MDSPANGREKGHHVNSLSDGSRAGEPIAIIGIGCRFPGGADDPDSFWKLLEEGVDAITEVPADRWNVRAFYDPDPGKPGKTQARWGGFIAGIDRFDPQFFGISPREAARMDPQQRLLLETAWEAIEDGGQPLERLRGSRTAVFVGISSWDYSLLQTGAHDLTIFDVYSNTGGSLSIAANRISYCWDLRGPSAAVDTACSSALVAVHLACRSIWEEGCALALAGGVNALLMPDWYVGFSRLNMLSPDGRCKAFDARANGFVRSEGAGMILLKPLGRALADGDRVHAVIRATAVNQDGRTPGMTVPSPEAQEALLREACRQAGIDPAHIHYIEAHGTGTLVGDPIEARALARVLSPGRPAGQPCWIGSVKTNIGHLEAGAGIAGLIKAALVLEHRRIPANLHFQQPNPEIDFERLQLRVPVRTEPWPQTDGPALAGVNSFGYGGTNAHVLLQEAPRPERQTAAAGRDGAGQLAQGAEPGPQAVIVPLSARGPEALRAAAEAMARFVQQTGPDVSLRDLAGNAARRRSHHDHRLAVVAASKEQLVEELSAFAAGQPSAACSVERVAAQAPRLAFVCCGQGPQWWAMGRQLLAEEPVFRDMIERCDAVVRQLGPWSLLEELTADESRSRLEETAISQPAIFALQVALAEVWRSWGVRPEAVIGHSVGEVAAAWLAGIFSLEDAVRVIYHRGRCMDRASSRGRMLAAGLTPDEALGWIEPYGERLALAAVNSPASVTLSGEAGALEEIARRLEAQGIFHRFLQVQYAFHSAQMEPVRQPLLAALAGLKPADARLPFFSTVTGRPVHGPELGPEYWWHNVRRTVRFADGVEQLIELGCDTVLELGPHPVLTASVSECYQRRGKKVTALYSLRRHEKEGATMRRALGALHVRGYPVDWAGVFPEPCRFVRLPSYPWQRERYWHELEASRDARLNAPSHPLLGWRRRGPAPGWQGRLDLRLFGWLADHRVQRSPIMPAAAYIDLALAAAHEHLGHVACQLEDIQFANPCFLSPERPLHLHTEIQPDDGSVRIHSRVVEGEPEWTLHFSATLRARAADETRLAPETIQSRCPRQFAGADCFVHFEKIGLDYGPLFKGIQQVWQGENESLGRVELPDGLGADAGDHLFHPALLDACLQVVIPAEKNFQQAAGALYLPIEVERFRLHRRPGRKLWSHARLVEKTSQHVLADLDIYDEAGELVAEVRGLRSQRVAGRSEEEKLDDLLFSYRWQEQDLAGASAGEPDGQAAGHWLILADAAIGGRLAEQLRARGQECTVVFRKDGVNDDSGLDPAARKPIFRLVHEQAARLRGIVHLWNLDAPAGDDLAARDLEAAQEPGLLSVVHLIQAWDAAGSDRSARLFLVTRGAQPMDDLPRPLAIAQTPALGLGRVVVGEYPRLRCKLVDLDPDDTAGLGLLIDEMLADDEEDEVAYRGGKRYVHRFLPGAAAPAAEPARQGPFRLASVRPGTIDGLALRPWPRQPPGPGQVEIAVAAAGLNFSDVMKALGLYPGLPDGPVALGAECSGIVTAVGAGVANLRPGDAVLAVAPFSFASHVLTRAEFVVRKPAALSFEQAAAIPIAYLTAAYALDCLAHLARGERVLIHSATGGVGLAAIELARRAGAEIFATAGSAEKRDHLRRLGIEHVMDSRSLAFADEVLERTAGQGVDVILNSLAGEAIPRGLAILADHGRFLEIGKRDIYQNSRLGLRPFRKNLSFFAIDLDRMMHTQPTLLGTLLEKLVGDLADGRLAPLPVTPFPITAAADAFRLMQHGKHMGKVVLRVQEAATIADWQRPTAEGGPAVEGRPAERQPHSSGPRPGEGSYLVVGGLGGFGLAAARWLAQGKAGHLVLVGRRGSRSPDAARAVAELEQRGVGVSVVAADVASEEDVARLLADIERTLPPLRGVIHSAMVLEDSLLVKLERTQLFRVLAPKLKGAWNLHRHTRQRRLDFFILFSSLASVLGHAGQAAYAAANAFLDGLAHHRRALGLPALAVNWGHLGEVGYLAVHRDVGERLERQGVLPFTVREALAILERSLERQQVQTSVMRADWSRWRAMGVSGRLSPRFAHFGRQAATDSSADLPTLEAVRQAAPDQRRQLLQRLVRDKVARVLGTSPERLDDDKPLLNLGIDSLMAVELRNWIEGELRVNLPIVELMRSPSLSSLSELLSDQLGRAEPDAAATPPPDGERAAPEESAPERLLANLDELSGEQVDALLSSLLADREAAPPKGAV